MGSTKEQQLASDPKASVWVSASAGTGKTKVLTDRVLRMLLQGVNPRKILCLTFTNAAAVEMSSRIQRQLGKWAVMDEMSLKQHLQSMLENVPTPDQLIHARRLFAIVLELPDGLNIQTIHAFCQSLLRRFPLESDVNPNFQLIDEHMSLALLQEAKIRLLTDCSLHSESLQKAIDMVVGHLHESSFTDLMQEMFNKRHYLESMIGQVHENWCERLYDVLGISKASEDAELVENFVSEVAAKQSAWLGVAKLMQSGGVRDQQYADQLTSYCRFSIEEQVQKVDDYLRLYMTQEMKPRKALASKKLLKAHGRLESQLLQEQQRVLELIEMRRTHRVARLTSQLICVVKELLAIYQQLKTQHAALDYHDLITLTAKLFHDQQLSSWVMFKLDGGIDHILVDEAQDTSPEQWLIIGAICEEFYAGQSAAECERTVFVVGDEKQSIYRFQGADPASFAIMKERLQEQVRQAHKTWRNIELDLSFRTSETVLGVVDAVFAKHELYQAVASLSDAVHHQSHRFGQAGRVELWPLVEVKDDKHEEPWPLPIVYQEQVDAKRQLAMTIASTIRGWLDDKRFLEAKGRVVQPGDIMILVRRRNESVDEMIRALKRHHIPVAGIDRLELTSHLAVKDLIALGDFLLLPDDDLTLAVVLKSPLVGLDEDQLYHLAVDRGDGSLWQQLKRYSHQSDAYQRAYDYLASLLQKVDFDSPFALYMHVLEVLKGKQKMVARLGLEALDPMDEFVNQAAHYETVELPSLQGFLHWLQAGSMTIKRDLEQGQNQVRIMTVHGAKGLQSPIVMMPDTTTVPSSSNKIVWTEGNDAMCLWAGGVMYENNLIKEIKNQNKNHDYQEYIRLLYVAMTRAEDELYVMGYHQQRSVSDQSWYQIIKKAITPMATEEEGRLVVSTKQEKPVKQQKENEVQVEGQLPKPSYLDQPPSYQTAPLEYLNPSSLYDDEVEGDVERDGGQRRLRGVLIHALLEILPNYEPLERYAKAKQIAASYDQLDFEESYGKVDAILNNPNFSYLFGENSKAEVAVTGKIGDKILSGRIDRLVVTDDQVLIVDYKTTTIPPESVDEMPKAYRWQMEAYKKAMAEIYPNHHIDCAILWVEKAELMIVESVKNESRLTF